MEKNKRGRPSVDSEAINLRLPRELIEAIDDRRRIESDLPTRPEMIRRALMQWLDLTAGK
ncbi:ribbon-helix-helix protein, CopG family [Paracoccus mangrovi]|uniref:Ribbon-helix-helix protein, CopG family n=1 Tax=Paracoccus mangrovi TaxID=1715645 RepID=A0ABV7R605_9RHOB